MLGLPLADTRISSAEFGDYHYERFLAWAFTDRQSKAALLRNLAVARTDSNQAQIDDKLDYYCQLYGLTREQLLARIREADKSNVSIAKLHDQLAKDAGVD